MITKSNPEEVQRVLDALSEDELSEIKKENPFRYERNAKIYAEVLGYASSADGYNLAALDPEGNGATRAMKWALENAGTPPAEVDYINAHGSSTPINDAIETKAIKQVFGEHAFDLAISSTKSMLGHAMGASGAIEAVACALAIENNQIPPTINYENPDPECDLYYVPNQSIERKVDITLSNSFGLGGQNACLVLGKYNR